MNEWMNENTLFIPWSDMLCSVFKVFGYFKTISKVLFFLFLSLPWTVWPWIWLSRTYTPWEIGSCLECFLLVNNLSHFWMTDSKLFENRTVTFLRLMGSKNDLSKITDDVFPPWQCVSTLQTCKLPKHLLLWRQTHLQMIN